MERMKNEELDKIRVKPDDYFYEPAMNALSTKKTWDILTYYECMAISHFTNPHDDAKLSQIANLFIFEK